MQNSFKKIISIFLSITLIFGSSGWAAISGTPQLAGASSIECSVDTETDYFPVGDSRGNSVLSKKEIVRDCTVTKSEQGECINWKEEYVNRSLTPGTYDAYESNNYSDSLGSLLSALGAYDQIEHLWSGWKGYCEIGTKSDYSWAEDPMFWASMAMSFLMQSTSEGGFLENSSVGEGLNGAANTAGNAVGDVAQSAGTDIATSAGDVAANNYIDTAANYTSEGLTEAFNKGVQDFYTDLGRCMIASGFEVMTSVYEFSQDDEDGSESCDPVDEICASGAEATSESDIMTMDEVQFNDLVQMFAESDPAQNLYDFVYVIPPSPEEGIVSFRMKVMNEFDGVEDMDSEAMDELKETIKETKLMLSLGATTLSFASCASGISGADVSSPTGTEGDRADLRQGLGMIINFAASYMGPYGAIIAAAMKIILYVATSYQSIDSCNDEDDAKEQGLRHERTQAALEFDLCHLVKVECAEYSVLAGSFLQNDCVLDGYNYCCYDQIMTKILVEQLKAQLARDWAHCTGITLRDLNYISFRQCSDSQMADSTTIDGAHQVGSYDPLKAFQHKYKCIDMTEFLEYLQANVSEDIDMSDFSEFWSDLTEQSTNGATY